MPKFADQSLTDFTAALASGEAVPGGGGAAALAAALGAALGAMVCHLTEGKPKYAAHEAEVAEALRHLDLIRGYLLRMVDEDARAFAPLQKVLAQPKDTPGRAEHLEAALRVACGVPTEVLYTAGRAVEQLALLAKYGCKGAVSDVGVGLELCRAAMRAARLNILVNAAPMRDEVFAMTLRRECELVFGQYDPVIDQALAEVEARLG